MSSHGLLKAINMLGSISKILSGTVIAQAISLLALPVIMRYYSPADYGIFGTALVLVGLVVIVSTMQLHHGIVMPKLLLHGVQLFQIGCAGSVVGGLITFAGAVLYFYLFKDESILLITPLVLAVGVVATGVGQCIQGMAVREKAFGAIGSAAVLRSTFVVGVQFAFGIYGFGYQGLLFGYVLGELVTAVFLWFTVLRPTSTTFPESLNIRHLAILKRYRDIASFGTFQEFLNSASQGLPLLIINGAYGPSVAGLYAFSLRVLLAPSQLVANAVRQVASERFSALINAKKTLNIDFFRLTALLAIPAILLAFSIIPFLPDLYEGVFGNEWRASGEFGQWLIIWAACLVFNTPSVVVLRILKKQRESFFLNVCIFTTRAISLTICGALYAPETAVAVFSVLGVIWNFALILLAYRYIESKDTGQYNG